MTSVLLAVQGASGNRRATEASEPMNDEIKEALTAVIGKVVQFAAEDSAFRSQLLHLLDAVGGALRKCEKKTEKKQDPAPAADGVFTSLPPLSVPVARERFEPPTLLREPAATLEAPPPPAPAAPLTTGATQLTWMDRGSPADDDLKDIEARCRLKAEACRWAATRRRLLAEGAPFRTQIEPKDKEMIEAGKSQECFLWMCSPDAASVDLASYEMAAASFETLAEAIGFVRAILESPDSGKNDLEAPLLLLAEAQSALRIAVGELSPHDDAEQEQVFRWLRRTTEEKQVFVRRHMKLNDPADPKNAGDLKGRIQTARASVEQAQSSQQEKKAVRENTTQALPASVHPRGRANGSMAGAGGDRGRAGEQWASAERQAVARASAAGD